MEIIINDEQGNCWKFFPTDEMIKYFDELLENIEQQFYRKNAKS